MAKRPTKTGKTKGKGRAARSRKGGLTPKMETFAAAYVKSGSAAEAYRQAYSAGDMSETSIRSAASKLLHDDSIRTRIEELQARVQERAHSKFDLSADGLIAQLARIAYSDPRHYAAWGTRETTRFTQDGEPYLARESFVDLVPSASLTDDQSAAIASVEMSISKTGEHVPNLKLLDRRGAVNDLMRLLGHQPPGRNARFDIGSLETPADCLEASRRIAQAVAMGEISDERADSLERRVGAVLKSLEVVDLASRIDRLVQIHEAQGGAR